MVNFVTNPLAGAKSQLVLPTPISLPYKRMSLAARATGHKTGSQDRIGDDMTKHPHETDVAFIQALAELLNKNDLTELTVKRDYGENDSLNVRVSKQITMIAAAPAPVAHIAPQAAPAAVAAALVDTDPAQHPGALTSPMVGTAYLSAEPGSEPFVSIGSSVTAGQTVLIIEAMKTMNQIPSPHSGTVKRILIDDGKPVEYGAPLMIIE